MRQKNLKENIEFVQKNKARFLKEYFNKYLLVCHKKVIDSFDTYEKAAEEGVRKFGVDENFLVYHLVETEPLNLLSFRGEMEKKFQLFVVRLKMLIA